MKVSQDFLLRVHKILQALQFVASDKVSAKDNELENEKSIAHNPL